MSDNIEVRILNMSKLDVEVIQRQIGAPLKTEKGMTSPKESQELVTLIVIGGIHVLSTAAAYFFGKRKTEVIEIDIEVRTKDGDYKRVHLAVNKTSADPVDNQIMSQIEYALGKGSA